MIAMREKFDADLDAFIMAGGTIDEKFPCEDVGDAYAVDFQYLMMNRWAFDRMKPIDGAAHDFGSKAEFVSLLASMRPVVHYDIRRPDFDVPGLTFQRGDLTQIPLQDDAAQLVSCLHVAEHVGLGRYGDEVDPDGFVIACGELSRILAPGGSLFFAVPVGQPRVVFNAHRVLSTQQVLDAFPKLSLREFSGISSVGEFVKDAPIGSLDSDRYGCGLFHFTKESK